MIWSKKEVWQKSQASFYDIILKSQRFSSAANKTDQL